MSTEFEISTRLMFWGSQVDEPNLISALKLDKSYVECAKNGSSSHGKKSNANTAAVAYTCDHQFPQHRRDPEAQLNILSDKLRDAGDSALDKCNVEYSELQIFFYYEEKQSGQSDFYIPSSLLSELQKYSIRMRVTILP